MKTPRVSALFYEGIDRWHAGVLRWGMTATGSGSDQPRDDGEIIAFKPEAPPLTSDYVRYIQRRLLAGLLTPTVAVEALRAREPGVTAERIKALLTGTMEGDQ